MLKFANGSAIQVANAMALFLWGRDQPSKISGWRQTSPNLHGATLVAGRVVPPVWPQPEIPLGSLRSQVGVFNPRGNGVFDFT